MADPKPYRAGLGLPSAITISSHAVPLPLPDNPPLPLLDPSSSRPDITVYTPKPRYPQGYTSYAEWKDWHINPTQHGPEDRKGPPVFVSATTDYDELGRSVLHGVSVEVDEGDAGRLEGREDGVKLAEWYTSLARGREVDIGQEKAEDESGAGPSKPRNKTPVIIDLTDDNDDDDHTITPTRTTSTDSSDPRSGQKPIIRIHSNEWFIRRALASSSIPSLPPRPPRPTSISNLLNIAPTVQNRSKEPIYVLGPDNKGHQLLREQLGWGGGGLGRPEGWEGQVRDVRGRQVKRDSPLRQEEQEEVRGDGNRDDAIVVDDSDDTDSSASSDNESETFAQNMGGPGRTAPIATALKLDRLGLGHLFTRDRPKSRLRSGKPPEEERENSRKKVTHTHEEILEAQRRAKYSLAGSRNRGKVELGKKGKIKWGERDKRERDERRRMIAAMNE